MLLQSSGVDSAIINYVSTFTGYCFVASLFTAFIIGVLLQNSIKGMLDGNYVIKVALINACICVLPSLLCSVITGLITSGIELIILASTFITSGISGAIVGLILMLWFNNLRKRKAESISSIEK